MSNYYDRVKNSCAFLGWAEYERRWVRREKRAINVAALSVMLPILGAMFWRIAVERGVPFALMVFGVAFAVGGAVTASMIWSAKEK